MSPERSREVDGSFYALQVLVSMASEDDLRYLPDTLRENGAQQAASALEQARAQVAHDIAMCEDAGF